MSDPVTAQPTRDQLRALANAATPGPWEFDLDGDIQGRRKGCSPDPEMDPIVGTLERDEDNEFIAAARTAVPRLLNALDAAEKRIRDLSQEARDERGAARDQMEQVRIRDARIQAVRDVLDDLEQTGPDQIGWDAAGLLPALRRALGRVHPPRQ